MATDSAFWRDLEARFRELLKIPEAARLTAMYAGGRWTVPGGPTDERERARLKQSSLSLARAGAIKAGVPNVADALDRSLDLLRKESPQLHAIEGNLPGMVFGLPLTSKAAGFRISFRHPPNGIVRAARAVEFETAATVAGVPALPDPTK